MRRYVCGARGVQLSLGDLAEVLGARRPRRSSTTVRIVGSVLEDAVVVRCPIWPRGATGPMPPRPARPVEGQARRGPANVLVAEMRGARLRLYVMPGRTLRRAPEGGVMGEPEFPVTDDDLDAPDGAVVHDDLRAGKYERVGDRWIRRE